MVVKGESMDDAERKIEGGHRENGQEVIVGIKRNQLIDAPAAKQDTRNLHDEQGIAPEHIDERREQHQVEVEMVAQHTTRRTTEDEVVVDAEMGIVIHDVGVEAQVERVGFEEVMVNQRDKGIQHASNGDDRSNGYLLCLETKAFHFSRQNYKKRGLFCLLSVFLLFLYRTNPKNTSL